MVLAYENPLATYTDPLANLLGDWSVGINIWSIILRVVLAILIGGLIGSERAIKHHVAGLRTYTLVCLGSCIAMMTNQFVSSSSDLSRLGAGVITGIGFLGAGSIMVNSRNRVRGLTTAAALWTSGAVGLAIGIGFYTLALASAIIIIIVLLLLPKFEGKLQKRSKSIFIHIELLSRPDLRSFLDYVRARNIQVLSISYDPAYANSGLSVYSIALNLAQGDNGKKIKHDDLISDLSALDYVNFVELMD